MTPHKCPVCNGSKLVSRPPHIAGDQQMWIDDGTGPYPCRACASTGIVWSYDWQDPPPYKTTGFTYTCPPYKYNVIWDGSLGIVEAV